MSNLLKFSNFLWIFIVFVVFCCDLIYGYETGSKIVEGKLNVHLVPHSHDDVGWLKTVDQYFIGSNNSIQGACVENVLDSVVMSLLRDPNRKFIFAEMAFFRRWWLLQSGEIQAAVKKLVAAGQLEFVNGGWCMHDEAATHYIDMIDQTTLGHALIKCNFNVTPRAGWQIDPFGHSAVQAYLLGAELGFDSLHFARIDYQDRAKRKDDKSLEVIWRGSKTFGSSSQIFTNAFPKHYSAPDGFNFEVSGDFEPIQDEPPLFDNNVQKRVNDFIDAALTQANVTRTNHIMWAMGDDFEYQYAESWFKQMDKLIHYVNRDGRVNALYSTPSIYTDAKLASNVSWPLKTDDYFPYADGGDSYWTGYFTSRPALKGYIRSLSGYYLAARQLEFLAGRRTKGPNTFSLGDALGIAQHHDAVTGTAKQHTTNDYKKRLAIGALEAEAVVTSALSRLTSTTSNCTKPRSIFSQCPLLNISYCPATEKIPSTKSLVVVAYNPLGWHRTDVIKIPVKDVNFVVQDNNGNTIEAQFIEFNNVTSNLRSFYTEAYLGISPPDVPKYWLLFQASVLPLGWNTYFITKSSGKGGYVSVVDTPQTDTVEIGPGNLKMSFSLQSGQLKRVKNSRTGISLPIQQSYLWYGSGADNQPSGAYIFHPDGAPPVIVSRSVPIKVIRGPLVDEVHQQFNPWVYQVTRLYKDKEHAEFEFIVMLAILLGLLTILSWHFTKVYTKSSLNTLAYGLRFELLQRPILRMWKILNSTVEITTSQVRLSEYVIRKYSKAENQAQQVELYEAMRDITWALFSSRKALNSMSIKYRNGFVQAFHRDIRNKNTYYIYSDLDNYTMVEPYGMNRSLPHEEWNDQTIHGNLSAIWYRELLDPDTGIRKEKNEKIPPDELLNIAGISQVPNGAATWHVAVSKFTNSPLLSAALPVWDKDRVSIVAVVGVTTALYSVGQLMKELVELHGGHIYLTSQEGWLLATSSSTPLLKNSSNGPTLMMAVDSQDEIIQSGAKWLHKAYGDKQPLYHEVHSATATLGGQRYYIDSFFLNLTRLPMVGVLCIPRKYIMGKVDERAFKTLVILISASVCILVVGCICIFLLTNGVSKEMKLRAELISQLDARRKAEASSNFKSQFLANMSHELRTPMAAVIGLLDILLCDDCLTNEQYSTITQIRRCSTALLRLLNNILDISKVESGKLVLEEAEFHLGRELEGLIDMFSVQCKNHNVETIIDLSDDMPRVVRGDSGRVVQIFANLISNSIKFTTSGYIILRGWCENLDKFSNSENFFIDHKALLSASQKKIRREGLHERRSCKNDKTMILFFEVEDTGCGIDPSNWGTVFESFKQADPSTTRLHGGTGLGLCIVRTLVNKMGGEIRVVKKNGPGTLMQLYLLLSTPADIPRENYRLKFADHNLKVVLALGRKMGTEILSQWLPKLGVPIWEANEWNELTHILLEHFKPTIYEQNLTYEHTKVEALNKEEVEMSIFIIVIDIGMLNLSTKIWKDQLNFLDTFNRGPKFAWILNQDTSNSIKTELRRRGHLLMVNRPLYKAKMIQMIEAVIKESILEKQKEIIMGTDGHKCLQIDPMHINAKSSNDSEISTINSTESSRTEATNQKTFTICGPVGNCFPELTEVRSERNKLSTNSMVTLTSFPDSNNEQGIHHANKAKNGQKALEGLRILLAEDTPILQRVATMMLEQMGAKVVTVGDGVQAVEALNLDVPPYDLILMDCQMPKMDGYEATKTIRKAETESESHIPIIALTAHAMSSDEAKCLEVGMDAYLTKPIDCKLMVSTILSLTKRI